MLNIPATLLFLLPSFLLLNNPSDPGPAGSLTRTKPGNPDLLPFRTLRSECHLPRWHSWPESGWNLVAAPFPWEQLSAVPTPGSKRSVSLQFLHSVTVIENWYFRSGCLASVTRVCFHIPTKELKTSAKWWLGKQVQRSASAGPEGSVRKDVKFYKPRKQ